MKNINMDTDESADVEVERHFNMLKDIVSCEMDVGEEVFAEANIKLFAVVDYLKKLDDEIKLKLQGLCEVDFAKHETSEICVNWSIWLIIEMYFIDKEYTKIPNRRWYGIYLCRLALENVSECRSLSNNVPE